MIDSRRPVEQISRWIHLRYPFSLLWLLVWCPPILTIKCCQYDEYWRWYDEPHSEVWFMWRSSQDQTEWVAHTSPVGGSIFISKGTSTCLIETNNWKDQPLPFCLTQNFGKRKRTFWCFQDFYVKYVIKNSIKTRLDLHSYISMYVLTFCLINKVARDWQLFRASLWKKTGKMNTSR